MTAFERRASAFLVLAVAAAAGAFPLALLLDQIGDERDAIRDYGNRIARLAAVGVDEEGATLRLRAIEGLLGRVEAHIAACAATPVSAFGRDALALLSRQGILPSKYRVVPEQGKNELELSFRCEASGLLSFVRDATADSRGWAIPYASIHADAASGPVEVVLRLSQ